MVNTPHNHTKLAPALANIIVVEANINWVLPLTTIISDNYQISLPILPCGSWDYANFSRGGWLFCPRSHSSARAQVMSQRIEFGTWMLGSFCPLWAMPGEFPKPRSGFSRWMAGSAHAPFASLPRTNSGLLGQNKLVDLDHLIASQEPLALCTSLCNVLSPHAIGHAAVSPFTQITRYWFWVYFSLPRLS